MSRDIARGNGDDHPTTVAGVGLGERNISPNPALTAATSAHRCNCPCSISRPARNGAVICATDCSDCVKPKHATLFAPFGLQA